jgi:hypothetical protein
MDATNAPSTTHDPFLRASAGQGTASVALKAIRLTVFAILAVFEPIIRVALSLSALVGVSLAVFNRYVVYAPHFPFWLAIGISTGCALGLAMYYKLMRFLTP